MDCRDQDDCPKAEDAAEQAVKKVFAILGVDINNPKQVEDFRMDLRFAASLRTDIQDGRRTVRNTVIGILIAGIAGALWLGFQAKLGGH